MLGAYGFWAAGLVPDHPATFSFRHAQWTELSTWRRAARERLRERIAMPAATLSDQVPHVRVEHSWVFEDLQIELLSWQLAHGPPTEALFLKPAGATEPLPGVVALHDHGGLKFFGWPKISQTSSEVHPRILDHWNAYGGVAWANRLARRGFAVLVPDAYAFGSRRVRLQDLPEDIRQGLDDGNWQKDPLTESLENVNTYNEWAAWHESIMAKSLFCAGTTWPGVWLAEDLAAVDVLCARSDVDETRIGCGGLSGGGLRTVFLAGVDERIACAVCVGMMSTWRDFLLHKSHTHTWMIYVPLLPTELDYPEILGLRVPQPTLVQNNREDPLFTLPEMERADRILQEVFEKADAGDRYRCSYYPGPHKFDLPMQDEAFEWFERWL